MLRENARVLSLLRFFFDMLCVGLSFVFAWYIKFVWDIFPKEPHLPFEEYAVLLYTGLVCFALLQYFSAMYESRRLGGISREIFGCFKNSAIVLAIMLVMLFFLKKSDYSRVFTLIFVVFMFIFTAIQRVLVKGALRALRRLGYNVKHLVVVGDGPKTQDFINSVKVHRDMGYEIFEVLESYDGLEKLLKDNPVDEVIISLEDAKSQYIPRIINICEYCGVKASIIPSYIQYAPSRPKTDSIDDIILINTRYIPLDNMFYSFIKRLFDFLLSLMGIIILSPVLLAIAIMVKLSSKGGILFCQERVGFNGEAFTIYKFRTMKSETDNKGWTVKGDVRVTKIGKFLRKSNLDELPQLFNVLKGDMSLIGPRPEQVHFVEKFRDEIPKYMLKHRVRPGMTGWAQVNGLRGDTSIEERIKKDLYYIENWSPVLDFKILFKTFFGGNKNAY
ncbi:MAG: undecaprenyl-phosphate glucose phosphotransferase [Clostridia bacterium]|nr:undecaprenyl-phosphate glucose phosphotransferase [Clostridia bacterium]